VIYFFCVLKRYIESQPWAAAYLLHHPSVTRSGDCSNIPRNDELAVRLLQHSAPFVPRSNALLGHCYEYGLGGLPQNINLAVTCYESRIRDHEYSPKVYTLIGITQEHIAELILWNTITKFTTEEKIKALKERYRNIVL